MATAATVDLAPIIDRQKIGAFHIRIVAILFLVVMVDGYDIGAAAYAAPALIREWHVAPAQLGGMFSAGLFAGLFGGPIMGWLADHLGRRRVIIGGSIFFGVFTLAAVLTTSLTQLIVLRFIAGLGISGMIPITIALTNEYAPRRLRATLFVLMFSGITFGGGIPGLVAARFMAEYGWRLLFWIGGILPILAAILVIAALPESIKYMALRPARSRELTRTLATMQPGLALDPNAHFVIGGEDNRLKFSWGAIFHGRLAWITPMFMLSNAINLMIFYFVNQWIPVVLTSNGISMEHAVLASTVFQFAGTAGGLAIMRPLDKWGFIPVPILFAIAIPVVAGIGLPGLSEGWTITMVGAAGFCLLGLQFGNIAGETNMYPTYIRSWGVGAQGAVGRVGSVIGPLVGGYLIGLKLPMQELYLIAAAPLVIGLINAILLTPLYRAEWARQAVANTALRPAAGDD